MRKGSTLILAILLVFVVSALPRPAAAGCPEVLAFLANKGVAINPTCAHVDDLRSPASLTTTVGDPPVVPPDNSITTFADGTPLPGSTVVGSAYSFTPVTDLEKISIGPTPTATAVPGIQVDGWFADDPSGEARFLLRFPDQWNGRLVVAGSSGTRSEFNGDWAWSDYVLPQGYAYASQNKGVLNLFFTSLDSATPPDASSCRLNPDTESVLWVHFYDNDLPGRPKPFTQWTQYIVETAALAQEAAKVNYSHFPHRTYAVGTSNGGYQVRRAMEVAPELFDGGVDWEGTFIGALENVLVTLPPAIENFDAYVASGYDPNSAAAQAIEAAGYPPDIVVPGDSLWLEYWTEFWEVTQCQWQKRFDPNWVTYTDGIGDVTGTGTYDYYARLLANPSILPQIFAVETTGRIKRPVITVAGTMDALLPIKKQARAYEDRVLASPDHAAYRLYEVQNGNHIEAYTLLFPQLQLIQPHAQKAFDFLTDYVEHGKELPASQCIPVGGAISQSPAEPGRCANLFAP